MQPCSDQEPPAPQPLPASRRPGSPQAPHLAPLPPLLGPGGRRAPASSQRQLSLGRYVIVVVVNCREIQGCCNHFRSIPRSRRGVVNFEPFEVHSLAPQTSTNYAQ